MKVFSFVPGVWISVDGVLYNWKKKIYDQCDLDSTAEC